jgi:hypothetical protein
MTSNYTPPQTRRLIRVQIALMTVVVVLALATAWWVYSGVYGMFREPRGEPIDSSVSPGGQWRLRTFGYDDLAGATGHTEMWAEVRATGTTKWRPIYLGEPADVSWRGPNTVVFVGITSFERHPVDVRTGDFGITPHSAFERALAWLVIMGAPVVVIAVGSAASLVGSRAISRGRAKRMGHAQANP